MFDDAHTQREIAAYQLRLLTLADRFGAGARSLIAVEAQQCADALTCLLEEAPLGKRAQIEYLIDRYETLRINCLH